jgi:hypothetical protein
MAYFWDATSRRSAKPDDLERTVDESPNEHNQLIYQKKQTPSIVANRDFLSRALWMADGPGFVYVTAPAESDKRPSHGRRKSIGGKKEDSVVRGEFPSVLRLTKMQGGMTKLELAINPHFGGKAASRFRWVFLRYARVRTYPNFSNDNPLTNHVACAGT